MKDQIFCSENDHADVVNIEKASPTIVELLNKINIRNNDRETSGINTKRRVKARRQLIVKAGSDCLLIKINFLLVTMVRKKYRNCS